MDDIDTYCERVGYRGPREPSLAVLRRLVLAHAMTIPFENLSVLLRQPVHLDRQSLYAKLVHGQRGGYCFEQNTLLLDVLRAFGFRAHGLAARVLWAHPPDQLGPRLHMLLQLELPEGPYIADVGFGGLTPTAPLRLVAAEEQSTPHETFRLVRDGDEFVLEARLGGQWSSLYRFSREGQLAVDYEVANWFTATHPHSLFVNHLMASRPAEGRRYGLFNNRFTARTVDGGSERRIVSSAAELRDVLWRHFGLTLPNPEDLSAAAAMIAAQAAHPSPFDDHP